jgi:hypothetical protein
MALKWSGAARCSTATARRSGAGQRLLHRMRREAAALGDITIKEEAEPPATRCDGSARTPAKLHSNSDPTILVQLPDHFAGSGRTLPHQNGFLRACDDRALLATTGVRCRALHELQCREPGRTQILRVLRRGSADPLPSLRLRQSPPSHHTYRATPLAA